MKTTTDLQDAMWDILCGMSGEDVARAMTNYHGNRLLSEGFAEFLVDEGYCDAEDLGLEDEDEEEDDDDEGELTCPYCYDTYIVDSKNGLHRCLGCGNEF